jgi:hypothetical protein
MNALPSQEFRIAKLGFSATAIALSVIITNGIIAAEAHAATKLYATDFSPNTLQAPTIAYSTAGWQDILGTNQANGNVQPITPFGATASGFDMIADATVSLSTLGNYLTNEIQQVTGPAGNTVYALSQTLKINDAAPPKWGSSQNAFMIQRGTVNNGDMTDTGDVYYTYWFKFQSDLKTQLGGGDGYNWRVMSEWKTGGYNHTYAGDYRIITTVIESNGQLLWRTSGDNNANGPDPVVTYWTSDNTVVPVPAGTWFKYEVFWHRSSGSDGRYWAAVNGQVIVDHAGPNMGKYNLPINRIMLANVYSGGTAPMQQWVTGLEIWDGFPCGVGVSCFGTSGDTIAPSVPSGLTAIAKSSTQVSLAWTASTDNVGVAGYRIYRNGTQIGTSATTSYTDASVAAGTAYNYTVSAYDGAGNASAASNTATATTPQSLNISSYYVGTTTSTSATINWITNISASGIVYYGTNSSSLSSSATYSALTTSHSLNLAGLNQRTKYYYKIKATDSSGAAVTSGVSSFSTTR